MNDKLTTKQRLFVESYLSNPNATEAARKAGYSGDSNTLAQRGAELVRNSKIKALLEERIEEAVITANEILTDVKGIAKNAEKDSDRLKAYEMLGKHLALWIDRQETSGEQRIIVEWTGDDSHE